LRLCCRGRAEGRTRSGRLRSGVASIAFISARVSHPTGGGMDFFDAMARM